ncbi:MAG: ECF-type sigma factor [Planctomycetota bacterium]
MNGLIQERPGLRTIERASLLSRTVTEGEERASHREGGGEEPDGSDLESSVEALLSRIRANDSDARGALFTLLYDELHRRARAEMKKQPPGLTLQATALLHDLFLHLGKSDWVDQKHFLSAASLAMHRILIDYARKRRQDQREDLPDGNEFEAVLSAYDDRAHDLEALDRALVRLATVDPVMAEAVELRFFGGLTAPDVARLVGLPLRTFERRWELTRRRLYRDIS